MGRAFLYVGRRRGPRGAEQAAAESWYGGGAEPGHDHEVRTADAGDQLTLAAARTAVGERARWHIPGEPTAELFRGRRPGDIREDRRPRRGHPRGTGRTA